MLSSLPCRVGRSDEGGNSQCKGLEVETSWGRVAGQSGRQSLWLLWVEWEGLAGADRVGLEAVVYSQSIKGCHPVFYSAYFDSVFR